jgi:hypothetical protein
MQPYVEAYPIGLVWVALCVITPVIELAGDARRRDEATQNGRASRLVLRITVIPAIVVLVASPKIAPGAEIGSPLVPPALEGWCSLQPARPCGSGRK